MKIGFTVGVWDLLHQGHLNFLKNAKQHCDFLHVGIMTDYWVRVQKGHSGRPVQSLEHRIVNLNKVKYVDNIVILDTLDMSQYLQMCHIWIKGEDQKNMRPFDFKNSIFITRTEGISTTLLIEKQNIL
jgi:glycerol-3-phosphate cytidylyltransferase